MENGVAGAPELLARISHQEPAGWEANARPQGCRGAIHRARLPTYCTLGDVHKLLPRAVAAGPFASSTAGRGEKCGLALRFSPRIARPGHCAYPAVCCRHPELW